MTFVADSMQMNCITPGRRSDNGQISSVANASCWSETMLLRCSGIDSFSDGTTPKSRFVPTGQTRIEGVPL